MASGCSLEPPGPVVTTVPVPTAPEGTSVEVSTVSNTQLEDVQEKSETCLVLEGEQAATEAKALADQYDRR